MFLAKHAVAHKNLGLALKVLQKTADDRPSRDVDQMSIEVRTHKFISCLD